MKRNRKILVLDNYDSFTFNLVHLIRELGWECTIRRNDQIQLDEIVAFDKILLSPGPGIPEEAGIMKPVIREYGHCKSILGVCLGHQGIAEVYQCSLYNMTDVLHGVSSEVSVIDAAEKLFKDVPEKFMAGHYHSWAVLPQSIQNNLVVTAINEQGLVMAITHMQYDVRGVQFHPESIMTTHGKKMLANWITG